MTSELSRWSGARVGRAPGRVVLGLTARKATRSGVLWGYIFGITVASSAVGYASAYPTAAARAAIGATFGSNAGLDAITGPAVALQTVAGYTAWKSLIFLSVIGAVWGLLIATRVLRGEEDAGRWEQLLTGQTTNRRATAQALGGLGAGFLVLLVLASLIDVFTGRLGRVDIGAGAMLFFAVASVSSAAMFLALGALTSQLAPTRRQAAGYAAAALGAAYALRMVADSGTGLSFLRWATPLGWVEELQPLTAPRPLALLPIALLTAALLGAAVHLAGARDLGASTFADRSSAAMHTRLLVGPTSLAVRTGRGVAAAWFAAIGATALLLGFVAKQAGRGFAATPSIEAAFRRLGARGSGAQSYLGVAFLTVTVLVLFVAIGQVTAVRAEESSGHLEHFLVRPVSRFRWLGGRLLVSLSVVVLSGLLSGLLCWIGAASQHTGVSLSTLLAAGLNAVPPALCLLGIGVLAIGVVPRATSLITYGVLAWSLLLDIIGSAIHLNHWLLDTSLFHQVAAAPAVPVNWTSSSVLLALGGLAVLGGALAFSQRDLAGD